MPGSITRVAVIPGAPSTPGPRRRRPTDLTPGPVRIGGRGSAQQSVRPRGRHAPAGDRRPRGSRRGICGHARSAGPGQVGHRSNALRAARDGSALPAPCSTVAAGRGARSGRARPKPKVWTSNPRPSPPRLTTAKAAPGYCSSWERPRGTTRDSRRSTLHAVEAARELTQQQLDEWYFPLPATAAQPDAATIGHPGQNGGRGRQRSGDDGLD